jgi:hypothetical protein
MDNKLLTLIAPRIQKNCTSLFDDGYYKESARDALVQVEKALKEKGEIGNKLYGVQLINSLFKCKGEVLLKVPLGEELQEKAREYFNGVFSYYRNYVAHDGALINDKIALRILVLSSELLELIESSELTLDDCGGINGIVRIGDFGSDKKLHTLLSLLDGYSMPESTYDGLFEMLAINGYEDESLEQAIRLGLLEMHSGQAEMPISSRYQEYENYEWFKLTQLGKEIMQNMANSQ